MFSSLLLTLLVVVSRFIGLSWGNGFFFHPDENNMATSISQMSPSNLNPNFFAYGQFPLYLGFFSLKAFGIDNDFANSILVLRFWSAVFSSLSILFFYLLFRSKLLVLLLTFTPGLIQTAHFGTTESLLVLVFAINLYLSYLIWRKPRPFLFFLISLSSGIGLATKISSLIFLAPLLLSVALCRRGNKPVMLLLTAYSLLFTIIFYILLSPYNLISRNDFLSTMRYETSVATGKTDVFYTTQFRNSLPYVFQFTHIFPYVAGLPIFVLSLLGLIFMLKSAIARSPLGFNLILAITSSLVYFLYFGQVYTKWTRFMSPIFFIFPLLASYMIVRFRKSLVFYILSFISILPGIFFMRLYFQPDIRLIASRWMSDNLLPGSTILSEAGNVINLPVTEHQLSVVNYDFYSNYNESTLVSLLPNSDYILVPSRRIFGNYDYSYHHRLFDGSLGFVKLKEFSVFNDEKAEETWSVFDHPTIRIFKKENDYDLSYYRHILNTK